MRRFGPAFRAHAAALRMLLVFTVILGIAYPLAVTAVAQIPGLKAKADGSLIKVDGKTVGSQLIGQGFTDSKGNPVPKYFQSRPSAAGDGYDPTATSASNLGPESIVDVLPDPSVKGRHRDAASADPGVLPAAWRSASSTTSTAAARSAPPRASAPCWPSSTAVRATKVTWCGSSASTRPARPSPSSPPTKASRWNARSSVTDYSKGKVVPIRGDAPAHPAVPADAVTASGSGLDPHISPAYAAIQEATVAAARHISRRRRPRARQEVHGWSRPRLPRRAAGQRPGAEPGTRPRVPAGLAP